MRTERDIKNQIAYAKKEGLEEGRKEGREEERNRIAQNLLKQGFSEDDIAQALAAK